MRKAGTNFRIVGDPMEPWRTAMPSDMHLKSEGFASTLFEPSHTFTLGAYCAEKGIPYADIGIPVEVDTFVKYGQEFQRRYVPEVENRIVTSLTRANGCFQVGLQDGGTISARRVIVASGILPYAWVPEEFAGLPESICSHSSAHHDFSCFRGSNIVVVGAGASAMDVAASAHKAGAAVTVVARRSVVRFQTPLGSRSLAERLRAPMTPVGPGWKSVLVTKAPLLFHMMPRDFRVDVVRRYLGPAPAWFIRQVVEATVPIISGTTISAANIQDGKAVLTLSQGKSAARGLIADHIIAATGYKVDIQRLNFLDPKHRSDMRCDDGAPRLSRRFESSVPGLYFIGTAAANSFGPMLRFACGAGFVARRLSQHLAATGERSSSRNTPRMQTRAAVADG
jgi:thioredoxin reductase